MPRLLPLLTAAAVAVLSGSTLGAQTPAEAFRPFEFLVGSCWQGTFPNGTAQDEHCFESLYDGQFIRDTHVVTGGQQPYAGETTYAWDAANRRISYWYIATSGALSTGIAEATGDSIVFPETHVSAAGTRHIRNVWRRTGPDTYRIEVTEHTGQGTRPLWSMEMRRTRPAE